MSKGERLDSSGDKDFVKWVDKPDGTSHIYYGEKGGKEHGHVVLNPPGSDKAISYERDKSGHSMERKIRQWFWKQRRKVKTVGGL
jgi:hypothetical protein